MIDDSTLLHQYVAEGSEVAFAELVRRPVDLVYSAALRQVQGDGLRAEDVIQAVFGEVARQAPRLVQHRASAGWVYMTARFIGARLLRSETRRLAREMASHRMSEVLKAPVADCAWTELQPVLDEGLNSLGDKDRQAIVLRFFDNRPLAKVGKGLGTSENAARMRVDRALEKLRLLLAARRVTSTASLLGTVLAAIAIAPAPTTLAQCVVGPALASSVASAATPASIPLTLSQLKNMKVGISIVTLGLAGVLGTYLSMDHANVKLRVLVADLERKLMAIFARLGEANLGASNSPADQDGVARLQAEHQGAN